MKTRLTEMLNIELPIMLAGMGGVYALWKLMALQSTANVLQDIKTLGRAPEGQVDLYKKPPAEPLQAWL